MVELLVVIAIISILAGLLLPALEDAIGAARRVACVNNQRQVGQSIRQYESDHDGHFMAYWSPDTAGKYWHRVIGPGYLPMGDPWLLKFDQLGILLCPGQDAKNIFWEDVWHEGRQEWITTYWPYTSYGPTEVQGSSASRPWTRWNMVRNPSRKVRLGDTFYSYNLGYWCYLNWCHADGFNAYFIDGHAEAVDYASVTHSSIYSYTDSRFRDFTK